MTEFRQADQSGLLVPVAKEPRVPARRYGPLEIKDDEARQEASEALGQLWDTLQLSSPSGIRLPGHSSREAYEAHYGAWEYFAKMLLGDDVPYREIMT